VTTRPDIFCIGAVLWDVIGRTDTPLRPGDDVPGQIIEAPGGVALNIATGLAQLGIRPVLLTAVGRDAAGDALIAACAGRGIDTSHVWRSPDRPTDRYVAIEAGGGLVAAIADTRTLEAAGDRILRPLEDGTFGSADAPCPGAIVLDGNLAAALVAGIATRPAFAAADLRVASAGSGKAHRLRPLIGHPGATFYLNRAEAARMLDADFSSAPRAAQALVDAGAARALVTDGAAEAALAWPGGLATATPPAVARPRATGAGDRLMAAHIAAEAQGETGAAALETALAAAAAFVAGRDPT